MRRLNKFFAFALLTGPLAAGCNAYRLEAPAGFAEVEESYRGVRYKASNGVGLNLRVFDNVKGGTLTFWSEDLVRKLGQRGYTLHKQTPARSKNGVTGARYDFSYTPAGTQKHKFFSVVLFPSDKHLIAIQIAGDASLGARYIKQLDEIASETRIRGCRPAKRICAGPQPPKLETPQPATPSLAEDQADPPSKDG